MLNNAQSGTGLKKRLEKPNHPRLRKEDKHACANVCFALLMKSCHRYFENVVCGLALASFDTVGADSQATTIPATDAEALAIAKSKLKGLPNAAEETPKTPAERIRRRNTTISPKSATKTKPDQAAKGDAASAASRKFKRLRPARTQDLNALETPEDKKSKPTAKSSVRAKAKAKAKSKAKLGKTSPKKATTPSDAPAARVRGKQPAEPTPAKTVKAETTTPAKAKSKVKAEVCQALRKSATTASLPSENTPPPDQTAKKSTRAKPAKPDAPPAPAPEKAKKQTDAPPAPEAPAAEKTAATAADSTKDTPKSRTPEQKAAHARFMRFSRSLQSWAPSVGNMHTFKTAHQIVFS